jgi:Ras homolog gene family, member A
VGLKSDLRSKRTCIDLLKTQGLTPVTPEQGQAVATRMGATYIECSSKEMKGVDRVFELAVNVVIEAEENSYHCHDGADGAAAGGDGGGAGGGSFMGGRKIKKRSCRIL